MLYFSLKGKVALITGATNGIGSGMAKGLVDANIDQLILTYRSESSFEAIEKEFKEINSAVKVSGIKVDLSAEDEDATVDTIAEQAIKLAKDGKIHILINNAGINNRHPFEEFPADQFAEVLKINLNIPIKLTKKIGTHMLNTKTEGSIVFTALLMSFQGGMLATAYAVTKGGINQFVKALLNEWSSKGIRVNAIAPGYIETKLTGGMPDWHKNTILPRIPIARWGNPDDFRGPIVFLTSDASRYITGETLMVDGGWMGR